MATGEEPHHSTLGIERNDGRVEPRTDPLGEGECSARDGDVQIHAGPTEKGVAHGAPNQHRRRAAAAGAHEVAQQGRRGRTQSLDPQNRRDTLIVMKSGLDLVAVPPTSGTRWHR